MTMSSFTDFTKHSYTLVVTVCVRLCSFNIFKIFVKSCKDGTESCHTLFIQFPVMNILHHYDIVAQFMNQYWYTVIN